MSVRERLLDACLEQWPSSYREIIDTLMKVPGIAIIELPSGDRTDSPRHSGSWHEGDVMTTKGSGRVRLYLEDHRIPSVEAREIAAALLAAADAAEAS